MRPADWAECQLLQHAAVAIGASRRVTFDAALAAPRPPNIATGLSGSIAPAGPTRAARCTAGKLITQLSATHDTSTTHATSY